MLNKIPENLLIVLENYLDEDEKILGALKEVWVPRYDFSWIVLTRNRVIAATKRFLNYDFKDYSLSSLDIDLALGFFYDEISLEIPGKSYKAQFYSFRRKKTLEFFRKIKEAIKKQTVKEPKVKERCEPMDVLQNLIKLQKRGVITEKEFEEKKKEMLKKI